MVHGVVCLATEVRVRGVVPAADAVAYGIGLVVVALGLTCLLRVGVERGPPATGGRGLLLLVGVART